MSEPKTRRARQVDLSREATACLTARRAAHPGESWVFQAAKGHPWDRRVVQRSMRLVLGAAGLPGRFTVHALRHSCASQLLSAGAPIQFVQRMLGHADITMTVKIYGSWLPMRSLETVDALDARSEERGER